MRAAIPTDLLLRLMNATSEQFAAVEKILGAKVESGNAEMLKAEIETTDHGQQTNRVTEDVARSAFALLQKLEMDAPLKAPSVLTVFRLYCVDGHSADQVARKCRCAKGTVMSRLRLIEERTGMKAEQFRAVSGHLQQVDDELNASGAREIYRRGLASDDS